MKTIIIAVLVWLGAIPVFVFQERKAWNNGICRRCGGKLYHADTDSQGGKMWRCEKCGGVLWTSWIRGVPK